MLLGLFEMDENMTEKTQTVTDYDDDDTMQGAKISR